MTSRFKLRRSADEARMSLLEHLDEFRSRIIKVGIAFFIATIVAWIFHERVFDILLYKNVPFDWPLKPDKPLIEGKLNVTAVTEQLMTDIKMALYVAFMLTIPVLLYQIWAFVAPAVGEVGRAFTYVLISLASSLFLAGVAFCYLILPVGLQFLIGWDEDRYNAIITAQFYLPFVTRTFLAFGIVFELPAATYVAAKLELVNAPMLRKYRKHAIVVNAILAAALTPGQDPYTMVLLAVPMIVMYEVSIIIARYVNPVTPETLPVRVEDDDEEDAASYYDQDDYEDYDYRDEEDARYDEDQDSENGYEDEGETRREENEERDL